MKGIRLTRIGVPVEKSIYARQNMYSVYFPPCGTIYFTNMKDAREVLAKANLYLNEVMHQLNYDYSIVFNEYRRLWFYIDEDYSPAVKDYVKQDTAITDNLNAIANTFELIIIKGYGVNAAAHIWNWLNRIISCLQGIISRLIDIEETRRQRIEIHRFKVMLRNIDVLKKELNSYMLENNKATTAYKSIQSGGLEKLA